MLTCTLSAGTGGSGGYRFSVSSNGGVGVSGTPTLGFAGVPTVSGLIEGGCSGSSSALTQLSHCCCYYLDDSW